MVMVRSGEKMLIALMEMEMILASFLTGYTWLERSSFYMCEF